MNKIIQFYIYIFCSNIFSNQYVFVNTIKMSSLLPSNYCIQSPFDSVFADDISKPIPQWYNESQLQRDSSMLEIEQNRKRIIMEFKKKYEITEEEKKDEKDEKEKKRKQRAVKSQHFIDKMLGIIGTKNKSLSKEELEIIENEIYSTTSIKERWEAFLQEEKQTVFDFKNLPGLFEVFPELKLFKWPVWSRNKRGNTIPCLTDTDCPFPQACCDHPIIPGDKFCCTGWGQRIMIPAYARQEIQGSFE